MAAKGGGSRFMVLGAVVALSASVMPGHAEAARLSNPAFAHGAYRHATLHQALPRAFAAQYRNPTKAQWRHLPAEYALAAPRRSLQCVPFARENSGIELVGNAATWWNQAAGVYARGHQPEIGSVLNFRPTGRMRLGHVAVVANVLAPRVVEIDHANWAARGSVSRGIQVEDVSPANDWTQVRVARGRGDAGFGDIYPTYGFIYDRPDTISVTLASARGAAATQVDEVAEAPDPAAPRLSHGWRHQHLATDSAQHRYHAHRHS